MHALEQRGADGGKIVAVHVLRGRGHRPQHQGQFPARARTPGRNEHGSSIHHMWVHHAIIWAGVGWGGVHWNVTTSAVQNQRSIMSALVVVRLGVH